MKSKYSRVSATLVLCAAALLVTSGGPASAQPASPSMGDAPGHVVSATPLDVPGFTAVLGAPVNAWRLLYASTDVRDNPITTSGLLFAPAGGGRSLVGVAHGSIGLGDQCAPSQTYPTMLDPEVPDVLDHLRGGSAVVVFDGQGLGTPGLPTYMVGQSAGRVMLDAVRAALSVPSAVIEGAPIGLSGYSEGGATTAWAAQLQPTYAPEVHLAGVVAGGMAADLRRAAEQLDGNLFATFLMNTAIGLDSAYPELQLESYLSDEGRARLPELTTTCFYQAIPRGAFATIDQFTTHNPLTEPAWQARLAENNLGATAPVAPLYIYHGARDELLPYEPVTALVRNYCEAGASVTLRTYPGTHFETLFHGSSEAAAWLQQRLDGKPTTGCHT